MNAIPNIRTMGDFKRRYIHDEFLNNTSAYGLSVNLQGQIKSIVHFHARGVVADIAYHCEGKQKKDAKPR